MCVAQLARPMHTADFVAIRVQEITQMHDTHVALTRARRVFNTGAAVGYGHIVEFLELLR